MAKNVISVRGARVHNLKNISIDIPKNALTVVTGLSGSGKSSLAFDTIYAEGQRRYAESLSSYARQFMGVGDKPDIDDIIGLSPTIAIDQKNISQNPRSTVGTSTEIYDLLRLLFARVGIQYDPATNTPIRVYSVGDIVEQIRTKTKQGSVRIYSPIIFRTKTTLASAISKLEHMQAEHVRINGVEMKIGDVRKFVFEPKQTYTVEILIGECIRDAKKQINLVDMVNKTVDLSNGFVVLLTNKNHEELLSTVPFSIESQRLFEPLEPRSFSFNSPHGACQRCTGLGYTMEVDRELIIPNPRLTLAEGAIQPWMRIVGNQTFYQKLLNEVALAHKFSMDTPVEKLSSSAMQIVFYGTDGQLYEVDGKQFQFEGVVQNLLLRYNETDSDYVKKEIEDYMREQRCSICVGARLKTDSLAVRIGEHNIADISSKTIEEAHEYFTGLISSLTKIDKKKTETNIPTSQYPIILPICKEIIKRLNTLTCVGLPYLTLDRSITTISGGEAQRIRLSTQLSSGLSDVVYILDEPSIGLHPKDTEELIDTLRALQKNGNTVIVVEHDNAMIEAADYIIDMGPGAGTRGGEIMAVGTPRQIRHNKKSLTGQYLANKEEIETPKKVRKGSGKSIVIKGAKAFNLKNVDVTFPLGTLLCVTGVSGSGKSTLVTDVLSKTLHKQLYRAKAEPGAHDTIEGINNIDKVITIDQKPIGRTPRSNPATYTGVFTAIRDLFTEVPEAKMRGLNAGMFSFNVKGGGRCEACAGDGSIRIPMQFLSDVYMECGECNGKRYTREALEVRYKEKTIADVLAMTIEDAVRFFSDVSAIREKLSVLQDVGLGYIQLGQSATTLSGGEAQRIKLATELSRRQTGKTLYILDEPTTGLHFDDIKRLLLVLNKLVDKGNTVLMIEHNLDVIKCCDWIIDMGPGGGKHGGSIVATGVPKDIVKVKGSFTGKYLKEIF